MNLNLVFIGAGKLATNLSLALKGKGFSIQQVYSRTTASARFLAKKIDAGYTTNVKNIISDADIYFVALTDAAFETVLPEINFNNGLIVHCSGSIPLSALKERSDNIGVLYPLQTFSKQRELNFKEIPIFIESDKKENVALLKKIARELSDEVVFMNSEKRKILHISAVFACNFVNHMYVAANELLQSKNIPFEVLYPLLKQTTRKVKHLTPVDAQTGPAIRYDENIIYDHLEQLQGIYDFRELYKNISKSIHEFHKEKS